jgi:hypothetical protein
MKSQVLEYVILLNTWGDEEVTMQDVQSGQASSKKVYANLTGCCMKVAEDGSKCC